MHVDQCHCLGDTPLDSMGVHVQVERLRKNWFSTAGDLAAVSEVLLLAQLPYPLTMYLSLELTPLLARRHHAFEALGRLHGHLIKPKRHRGMLRRSTCRCAC